MSNFQIETVQNIRINQNIASLGNRIGATLIDYGIIYAYFLLFIFLFSGALAGGASSSEGFTIGIFIIMIPVLFYDLFFEYYMNGQTPGKKVLKIQVVKTDGSSPDFIAYFLRWVFRVIDVKLGGGVIAIITYLVNGKGQRLGDIVADTMVVDLNTAYKSNHIFIDIPDDYIPTFPHVTLFSDEDMSKIKELYIKGRRNDDSELLSKLRTKIIDKIDIVSDMDDIDFIKTIVKDYYYFYYKDQD